MKLGPQNPFHVISAYRSPLTNAKLRRRSRKVAKNSYHMKGMAVDIRLPLRRWINMADLGWFSGETHVHRTLDELPTAMLAPGWKRTLF